MGCVSRPTPLALLLCLPVAACANSNGGGVHGPVFNVDSGGDVATDVVPDGSLLDAQPDRHVRDASTQDVHVADARADSASRDAGREVGPGDASDAAANVCPSGHGTIALVGGASSVAFGAVSKNGDAFAVTSFSTTSVGAMPGLVALAGGFLTVFPAATTQVFQSAVYSGTWSTPGTLFAVGDSGGPALGSGAPALVAAGSSAHLVYLGTDDKFYHDTYASSAWGPANDPVGGAASQGFGDTAPTAAYAGSTLYAGYNGSNALLYVDPWSAGTWGAAASVTGATVSMAVPPTLATLTGGGLLFVYESTGGALYSATYTGGAWSQPIAVNAAAITNSAVSVAPLTGGGAVMVYLGATNALPYFSIYTAAGTPGWSVPAEVYPSSLPLQSAPSVAAGTCGVDAVAALVETAGVEIVTLGGSAWSQPVVVGGTGSMTYASIATSP